PAACGARQLRDDFERVRFGTQASQSRRLVAGTGADLQDPLASLKLERLAHEGDDVGLADRLPEADRDWIVRDGFLARHVGHEVGPAQRCDGRKNALILDAARLKQFSKLKIAHGGPLTLLPPYHPPPANPQPPP